MKKIHLPPLGQRIVKTSAAVFLCLVFYYLRGYRGQAMSAEAAITAIICMQPYVHDSKEFALNRFAGTLIGAFWGFVFLLLVPLLPGMHGVPLYALMGLGILISLYSAVVIRRPDTSSLAAIVFICVVIAYPDIEQPLDQAFHRLLDVLVGTAIAIGVNVFRLPRVKHRDRLFFVRTGDLTPDQLSPVPPSVLYRLNYLYNDGAAVCLISEHAPAFFMSQMNGVRVSVPLIVMDGAGIFDADENVYLSTINMPPADSLWLRRRLDGMGVSYFVYTVHKNRNCIYHRGTMTREEEIVYRRMKRSPYRQYLDDDRFAPEEVVYVKVVSDEKRAADILEKLDGQLRRHGIRTVIRPQAGLEDGCGLYFYAAHADVKHAKERVLRLMREKDPGMKAFDVFSERGCRTEHDAVQLLHRLSSQYEPVRPLFTLPGRGRER